MTRCKLLCLRSTIPALNPCTQCRSRNHGVSSLVTAVTGKASVMLRTQVVTNEGEGQARLPLLYASFAKLGSAPSPQDIIENNRAINWPVSPVPLLTSSLNKAPKRGLMIFIFHQAYSCMSPVYRPSQHIPGSERR